jgi:hypothetical protein
MNSNSLPDFLSLSQDTKSSTSALHFKLYLKNPAKMLAFPTKLQHNNNLLINMIIHIK